MRLIYTFLFLSALAVSGWGQVTFYTLDFDPATNGLDYTTSSTECTNGTNDYFIQTDESSISATFSNSNGNFFAAQDMDGGSCGISGANATLSISGIDISGYTGLEVCIKIAEDDASDGDEDWDGTDFFHFNYSVDGAGISNGVWVEGQNSNNTEPTIDADFNGQGDGTTPITDAFTEYCFSIPDGASLNLIAEFDLDSGDEDIAIDDILVKGTLAGPTCGVTFGTATYTCLANTLGTDAVTIDIPYAGVDAGITSVTTTSGGTVIGDDPAAIMDGTITITGLSEGDAWDVVLNGGPCDGTMLSGSIPSDECQPVCPLTLSNLTVSCDAYNTFGDTYTYTIDFMGGGTETYTVNSTNGTVDLTNGDPSSDAMGTITVTSNTEGVDDVLTVNSISCMLTENITTPICDPSIVNFSQATYSFDEAAGTVDICVSITNPDPNNATTVDVALTGGDATNGTDIATYVTQTVTFLAGSSVDQCVSITITDDGDDESDETLIFTLQNSAGGFGSSASLGPTPTTTVTIVDNDINCPNAGDLVITEIMQNPASISDASGEYFEVYNSTGSPIDMMGMVISDDFSDSHTIAASLVVPAGGYVTLSRAAPGFTSDYIYTGITLANGDDEVIITCNVTEIDRVNYDGGPNFPDPTGASMSLDPDVLDFTSNDDGSNWCETAISTFGLGDFGTPGLANDECCPATQLIALVDPSSTLTLNPADACDADDGYTYYGDGTGSYYFAIDWAPDGSITTNNQDAKDNSTVTITTTQPGTSTNASQGTWTMQRFWNVDNTGNDPDETVDIKFYYNPTEKTGTDNAATSSGFSPIETSVWFKTVGQNFDPTQITPGSVGQGAVELTVVSDGNTDNGVTYVELTGISSFSGGTYAAGAGDAGGVTSLPVMFSRFELIPANGDVKLVWETTMELNNDFYTIERSIDGQSFENIGSVQGAGTVNRISKYEYLDDYPFNGVNYYRIAQHDYEGKVSYTDTKLISVRRSADDHRIAIYPTLVNDLIYYETGMEDAKMIIMSLDGSVYEEVYIQDKGSVPANDLGPGMYTITIRTAYHSLTERIIKI